MQKAARKNSQQSKNEIILQNAKNANQAKAIAFKKSSLWVKN